MSKSSRKTINKSPRRNRANKACLPTVTAQKVLEEKSRAIFTETISPWLVTNWTEHDYGIDAIVEIVRAREAGNNDATGKRFAVQLKATEDQIAGRAGIAVRVRPEHIRYWLESTEPVALIVCHVPTRSLFYRWIDYAVVDELNKRDAAWIGQETASVLVPTANPLNEAAKTQLDSFVTRFQPVTRKVMLPGTYASLHARITAIATALAKQAREAEFQSVVKRLTDLKASIRASTYVVALTGPPRAGKSTLLNALVGRDISPVGRLPTTAVSLLVSAGAHDEAEVVFASEKRISGDATSEFLVEYATQENNPDNTKGVRIISVRLVNHLLERGVAYADAPGLHDPSPEIRAVTEAALRSAHAVLYIIDVSPAKNGGFSITVHHVEDLKRLRDMADRLFIVLNKADVLSVAEQEEIAKYVERTLRKYELWDSIPSRPLFLSASAAWDWIHRGRDGKSPLLPLEEAIWKHLLATNSTGFDRLSIGVIEIQRAASDLASLIATRRMDGLESFKLRRALEHCRAREGALVAACRQHVIADEAFVQQRLVNQLETLLMQLKTHLEQIPIHQNLPLTSAIEKQLQTQVFQFLTEVWRETSARLQNFASYISQEVEKSLQQARLVTGAPDQVRFLLPQIPALSVKADSFEEAWTGLFAGGLFGLLIGAPWALALAASGWLLGAFLGRERRRKREIDRLLERARASLKPAIDSVFAQVREKLRIYLRSLEHHVADRIGVFVQDVERQLSKLGTPLPPTEEQRLCEIETSVRTKLSSLVRICLDMGLSDGTAVSPHPAEVIGHSTLTQAAEKMTLT